MTKLIQKSQAAIAEFVPMTGMRNRHVMTIVAGRWSRQFPNLIAEQEELIIEVDQKARVLVECNFANNLKQDWRAIAIILHGLEGSSRSHYVLGIAEKLVANGISAARMNMRNCGGTIHLSNTLYNAGLSSDPIAVAKHFLEKGFDRIFLIGYSLGGNIVLKASAELAANAPWLAGVCAVSPSVDLNNSVKAIELGFNRIYEINFLRSLKSKIVEKDKIEKGKYDVKLLKSVKTIRHFDDVYTAPDGGYKSALDYYTRASALPMMASICAPTLIVTAQDDPIVPFSSFHGIESSNERVELVAPMYGGHAGFVGVKQNGEAPHVVTTSDRFWAEKRCAEFCNKVLKG